MAQFRFYTVLLIMVIVALKPIYGNNDSKIDSIVRNVESDSLKVHLLLKEASAITWSDVHTAQAYLIKALDIAEKINYSKGIAYSKFELSKFYSGYDFELSEKFILEALTHANEARDSLLIAKIYCSIGVLKYDSKVYNEAEDFYHKALKILLRNGQDSIAAQVYNNLGVTFDKIYHYSIPNLFYDKAIKINKANNNYLCLATNYINLAEGLHTSGKYQEAEEYLKESYVLVKENNFSRLLPWIYNSYCDIFASQDKNDLAIIYADSALHQSKLHLNLIQELEALKRLHESYYKKNDLNNAYIFFKLYCSVNDSIKENHQLKQMDVFELKLKYSEELKQQQLDKALLKNQIYKKKITNIWIILLSSFIILILLLAFTFQRARLKRKTLEKKNIQLENEKINSKLEYKNKELTTNVMYLLKKNEFIASVSNQLKTIINEDEKSRKNAFNKILHELSRSICWLL